MFQVQLQHTVILAGVASCAGTKTIRAHCVLLWHAALSERCNSAPLQRKPTALHRQTAFLRMAYAFPVSPCLRMLAAVTPP
jgi:hypothetical protein